MPHSAKAVRLTDISLFIAAGAVTVLVTVVADQNRKLASLEAQLRSDQRDTEPSSSVVRRIPPSALSIEIDATIAKGNRAAPVALIEYTDLLCPFCRRFAAETLPDLERTYIDAGLVVLFLKHLPLVTLHPRAHTAAEAAECAGRQGRFWLVHDWLIEGPQGSFTTERFLDAADGMGILRDEAAACLKTGEMASKVSGDLAEARELGLRSTPMFFVGQVNGEVVRVSHEITGAQPLEVFRRVLDSTIRDAR